VSVPYLKSGPAASSPFLRECLEGLDYAEPAAALAAKLPDDPESKSLVQNALNAIEAGERCALIIAYDPEQGVSVHEFHGPHGK
jgi:hypothetical protein